MSDPQRKEQNRPRERLRQTEERFRMLADNMSQLAWTCDLLGNVSWYNKRWLDYTGLTFEDMKGWDWTKVQHPDHVGRVVARVKRSGETGEPWEDTFPVRGKDGTYRWFLSRALPIRDEQGNLVQWFGTNTDVTEQKLAEEQMARQAQELRALNERLRELDRLKTEFFSSVSHEFRTPLTLLLDPIEDGLADTTAPLPPAQRERQEVAHRNAMRLLRLVNTLLDFARIEAGRVDAVYEPVDLAALTADLASVFRSAMERAGLTLIVDCPTLAEAVYVDRDMWEKIVLNLVSNAFKFTFEGAITVTLRPAGDTVELRVRDTGTGIAAGELPHLFERFHRVRGARGRTHEGSGIGLALVQELVKLHGGTVGVTSELGRGTTFTVALPVGRAHLPPDRIGATRPRPLRYTALGATPYVEEALRWLPDEAAPDLAAPSRGPLRVRPAPGESDIRRARILWADDNADMRDYVRRLLGGSYDVEAVVDGKAALAATRAHPPDLVLADVMMPQLDGLELLRELRRHPETRALPVILLSARAGEESRIEGFEAGADDYLIKPFSARELLARVAAHLEIARLRHQAEATSRALTTSCGSGKRA
jgi:PAS domain S-box-containing protein